LYSTRAALPTLPIDGCLKGLTLHHPLNHVTVAILVTNAIVKITSHFLQWYTVTARCIDLAEMLILRNTALHL